MAWQLSFGKFRPPLYGLTWRKRNSISHIVENTAVKLRVRSAMKSQNRRENENRSSILSSLELAYSTFLEQVRLLSPLQVSFFDVSFPIVPFEILNFSFLVHISALRDLELGESEISNGRGFRC